MESNLLIGRDRKKIYLEIELASIFTARVKSSKKKFQLRKKKDIKNLETGITARFSTIHQNEEEKLKISRILRKESSPSSPIQRRSVSTESLDVFFLFTIEFSCSFSFFLFSSNRQFFLGPDDRQRLHKIGMKTDKEKEKREKEQQRRGVYGNKNRVVSLVLYALRAASRILIYAFPLSSVPSLRPFSTFPFSLRAFGENLVPAEKKRGKKGSLSLSLLGLFLCEYRALYIARSRV